LLYVNMMHRHTLHTTVLYVMYMCNLYILYETM